MTRDDCITHAKAVTEPFSPLDSKKVGNLVQLLHDQMLILSVGAPHARMPLVSGHRFAAQAF